MISVIIPTRNRARFLDAALRSLLCQEISREHFEVLVIDNGSVDDTSEVVKSTQDKLCNLRYLYEGRPGLHVGRHRGMLEAIGDVLVFADDDIEALPCWLTSIRAAFVDAEVVLVGGNNLPKFIEPPPDWLTGLWLRSRECGGRAMPLLSLLDLSGPPRSISPYYVWGCNFAIRKDTLLAAGGFHPDGMPPELLRFRGDGETHVARFVADAGLKCLFHPGASVFHKVSPDRMTHVYFRKRGFCQGISDSFTALRGQMSIRRAPRGFHRRLVRWCSSKFKTALGRLQISAEGRTALEAVSAGHREGFAFHQNAYKTDPEVRDWVHRERYY